MMRISLVSMVLVSLLLASRSYAAGQQTIFHSAFFYAATTEKSGSSKVDRTKLIYNVGLGVVVNGGFYLGLKYFNYEDEAKSGSTSASKVISGPGLSLGYFHKSGFSLVATYLLEPTLEGKSSTGDGDPDVVYTYKDGEGTVVDIGYIVGQKGWGIGPQVSLVETKYGELETDSATTGLDEDYEVSLTYPYFAFVVYF